MKSWRMRLAVLGVAVALAAGAGAFYATVVAQSIPPGPPPSAAPLPPPPLGPRPLEPRTPAEAIQQLRQAERETGGRSVKVEGPETAGSVIHIRGRAVQLPKDAYIEGVWLELLGGCTPSPCPKTPIYEIKRSNSIFWVSIDGTTGATTVAPGEEHLFDFIKEVLR